MLHNGISNATTTSNGCTYHSHNQSVVVGVEFTNQSIESTPVVVTAAITATTTATQTNAADVAVV